MQWPWKRIESDRGERELFELGEDPLERRNRQGEGAEERLAGELADVVGDLKPRPGSAPPIGVSPEIQQGLKELGYIE